MNPTTQTRILVSKEVYVARCNQILADPNLGETEKVTTLMAYASKVQIQEFSNILDHVL